MKVEELNYSFKRYALHERGMRPKSYRSIMASITMLTRWAETPEIEQLSHGIVREFLYWGREERGWEARTFRNHRQYLSTFFSWCVKQGIIKIDPTIGIEKPRLPQIIPRGLAQEEVQIILNRARWYPWRYGFEAVRNETILYLLTLTGIRLSEMLRLEETDINLICQEILVRQGKGKKDRVVPIHPRLMPVLRTYIAARKSAQKQSRYLITGAKSDKPLGQKNVQIICKRLSQDTGIKFTPHMLRHTFGRLAVECGWDIFKIKEVMGHTEITTTQRYLSASTENIKRTFSELPLLSR